MALFDQYADLLAGFGLSIGSDYPAFSSLPPRQLNTLKELLIQLFYDFVSWFEEHEGFSEDEAGATTVCRGICVRIDCQLPDKHLGI
ncbi:hypothetical protein BDV12DRAFT_203358 [Aspergillus spectabilis]